MMGAMKRMVLAATAAAVAFAPMVPANAAVPVGTLPAPVLERTLVEGIEVAGPGWRHARRAHRRAHRFHRRHYRPYRHGYRHGYRRGHGGAVAAGVAAGIIGLGVGAAIANHHRVPAYPPYDPGYRPPEPGYRPDYRGPDHGGPGYPPPGPAFVPYGAYGPGTAPWTFVSPSNSQFAIPPDARQ